jgi:succinate-acetate transporter protein
MSNTKLNWFLLVLFCVLTVLFCIVLVMVPANGDKMNTLARIGYWLGVIASAIQAIVQVFEIRRKNRDNKQ